VVEPGTSSTVGRPARRYRFRATAGRRELRKLCLRVPDVRASTLGADSVALGALRLALNEVDQRLFSVGLSAPVAPRRDV
jgi:hypothetical protein